MKKCLTNISNNYAQAIFETGSDFGADLKTVLDAIKTSADFVNVISNPAVDINVKYSIIDEIFGSKIAPEVVKFLKILVEKERFGEFEGIYNCYITKVDEADDIKEVEIISAIPLNETQKNEIKNKLSAKLNKKIVSEWVTDENIIGGLVFKIGDDVIDTSLKKSLDDISKNIR